MAFSQSGSIITQSGTDANLSGLASISAVTTITSAGLKTYNLAGNSLTVTGTLTLDPRTDRIINAANITVNSGGVLNVGVVFTTIFGGGQLLTQGDAITFQGIFVNNGTFNQRGAAMVCSRTTAAAFHQFNATTLMQDAIWRTQAANNHRMRMSTNQLNINGLTTEGVQFDALMTPTAATVLGKISPADVGVGIENALASGAGTTTPQVFDGVPSSAGKVAAFTSNWMGLNDLRLFAVEQGSAVLIMPDNCGNATTSGHGGRIYHRFKITAQTAAGANIQGAKVYVKDSNHGLRKVKHIKNNTPIDHTADQVLTLTTAANGETALTDILTCHQYRNNTVGDIASPDGQEIRDIRGKNNIPGDDRFDVRIASYGHDLTTLPDVVMNGLTSTEQTVKLLPDVMVTQGVMTTVTSYTQINSSERLYDYAKAYLINNYAGETQTLITRQGDLIDARALSVIFLRAYSASATYSVGDYVYQGGVVYKCAAAVTAAQAFTAARWTSLGTGPLTLDNTKLLVYAGSTFSGSLRTTGTITPNATSITGSVEDSTGVRIKFKNTANRPFNLEIRDGTGAGTAFLTSAIHVSEVEYSVPRGKTVHYAMWSLGYDVKYGTYQTNNGGAVLNQELQPLPTVNTALDVASILSKITLSASGTTVSVTFTSGLTAHQEEVKATFHRLLGSVTALRFLTDIHDARALHIEQNKVRISSASWSLNLAANFDVTQKVSLQAFFDTTGAESARDAENTTRLAQGQASLGPYTLNPALSGGARVIYSETPIEYDPAALGQEVESRLGAAINAARDHARAANLQTQ